MRTILILRLSSMGDVLLTLPVLRGISCENQDLAMVMVTRGRFAAFFQEIRNLQIIEFDPQNRHKGFLGLLRLFMELRHYKIDKVIDLHGVWRTYFLDLLFSIGFHRVYMIRKYRGLRHQILSGKTGVQIPHTTNRYLEVFNRAGYYGNISLNPLAKPVQVNEQQDSYQIGIAPLARHNTKNWRTEHINTLIDKLLTHYKITIYLFGGQEDQAKLETFKKPSVINIAGNLQPDQEIELVRTLDLFISMDSANMHLAALAGVPTLSVWGATDPAFGFSALGQPDTFSLFAPAHEVPCRPCSAYGARPCHRKDHPMICMDLVTPGQVYHMAEEILGQRNKI